jgi:hypothetical protein
MLNKDILDEKFIDGTNKYEGVVYLICCIGVEYDYDIVSHSIKYYRELGVDRFLFILNTEDENSEKLKYVQNILRKYNIEEEMVWIGEFDDSVKTRNMEQIVLENTDSKDWVITIDVDEFHKYDIDLKKFIFYCEKKNYNCVWGRFVDRLTENGKIVDINEDTNIWDIFPVKTDMRYWNRTSYRKILLRKSYIKVKGGHHFCVDDKKCKYFPYRMEVHHFKWRGELIKKLKRRVELFKKHNLLRFRMAAEQKVITIYKNEGRFR